jgi:hypothetical protein
VTRRGCWHNRPRNSIVAILNIVVVKVNLVRIVYYVIAIKRDLVGIRNRCRCYVGSINACIDDERKPCSLPNEGNLAK